MLIARTGAELREQMRHWRGPDSRIALVPTMGNLHAGHLQLVRHAKAMAGRVVVSIFVNPMQFGPEEDFASYPRTVAADQAALMDIDADLLFLPDAAQIYHQVQPDIAVFGEKDFQQLLLIRRMVADLCMPIRIDSVATVREPDGLAMSSRNAYLAGADRTIAPQLYQTLLDVQGAVLAGERDYAGIERAALAQLAEAGFVPDYVSIRRAADLALPGPGDDALIALAAAVLGHTRLIDNVRISTV
jgi:pantoate--beta-alanine ligase